jgi:hypothetical protein
VHHQPTGARGALGDELLLGLRRVHEQDVGLTAPAELDGLPTADRQRLDLPAGVGGEGGQQLVEQPGVLGARGGGEDQRLLVGRTRRLVRPTGRE